MKKGLLLLLLAIILLPNALFSQVYQLPNGGFEQWDGNGTNDEPTYWNGFPSGQCDLTGLAAFGCGTATSARHSRSEEKRPNSAGTYSCRIFSTSALGIVANGNITTGQIRIGSTTPTSSSNYNITRRANSSHNQPFHGRPDSIRFWVKLVCASATTEGRVSAIIHGDVDFIDPVSANQSNYLMAQAIHEFPRITQEGTWVQYSVPFVYNSSYSRNDENRYILITFTTNKTPGGGSSGDVLFIDDIEMVYNSTLSDLQVAGASVPGFAPNVTDYYYPGSCCATSIPEITVATTSPRASVAITQASMTNPITTITVTNSDATKTYRVHFNIFNELPLAENVSRCGTGVVNLSAVAPQTGDECRWYLQSEGGSLQHTGEAWQRTLSSTTTYYVSTYRPSIGCESARVPVTATVYPRPATTPTISNIVNCGELATTLTPTIADGYTCYWYNSESATEPIFIGNEFTTSIAESSTFFLRAGDSETGCTGDATPFTITIHEIPEIEIGAPAAACAGTPVTFTATTVPTSGLRVEWFDSLEATSPVATGSTYSEILSETTTMYAQAVNTTTNCRSEMIHFTTIVNAQIAEPQYTMTENCDSTTVTIQKEEGLEYTCNHEISQETSSQITLIFTENSSLSLTITNQNSGCANSFNFAIPVKESFREEESATACESYIWMGTTYTESGMYTREYRTVTNCDSVYFLNLTINHATEATLHDVACTGIAYTKHGFNILHDESGEYIHTKTLENAAGCDSVITLHLSVNQRFQTSESATICASELPYNYLGETFTVAGSRNITLPSQSGCDSVITFTLRVNPTPGVPTTYPESVCEGEEISLEALYGTDGANCRWYDLPEGGERLHTGASFSPDIMITTTFYVSSVSSLGCESICIPVTGTVNPRPTSPVVTPGSRCGTGEITLTVEPAAGELTYNWYTSSSTNTVLHTGNSMTRNISTITTTTYYVAAVQPATACMSTRTQVAATAHPLPTAPQVSNAEICAGETITITAIVGNQGDNCRWYVSDQEETPFHTGTTLTIAPNENTNWHISTVNTLTQCESAIRTVSQVTVNPTVYHTFGQEACGEYAWNDSIYTASGTYSQTFTSSTGCDSTATLNLTILDITTNHIQEESCESYTWNGNTYRESGIYEQTFINQAGCDSIVFLTLTIHSNAVTNLEITACDEFTWNNITYITSQTIGETLSTIHGCDSIVNIHLTINHSVESSIEVEACESYSWYGEILTETGIYSKTLKTAKGCDSTEYLHLTIYPAKANSFSETACDSYTWNDITYTESGEYTQVFETEHGCDSVVTLNLTLHPSYSIIFTDFVCQGEPYSGHGFTVETPVAGTFEYINSDTTLHGCDSVVTLQLTVRPTYRMPTREVTICENGSTNFYGEILSEAGYYEKTLTSRWGCDSIVSIDLQVENSFITRLEASICRGEVYNENGFHVSESGVYDTTYISSIDCDSIVYLTLTVNEPAETVLYDSICQGEIYADYGFLVETDHLSVGTVERLRGLQTMHGCDSMVTLHLTILPSFRSEISDVVCFGEAYMENGFEIAAQAEAGEFTFPSVLTAENGCDSIIILTLTVLPKIETFADETVCDQFEWNGTIYTNTGAISQNFTAQNGCDSVVVINLTVHSSYSMPVIYDTICEQMVYDFYGITLTETGIYDTTFNTQNGCDSVITLNLTVIELLETNIIEDQICMGQIYHAHGFVIEATEPGFITDTLHYTVLGCDSMVVLQLTIHPTEVMNYEAVSCYGSPFVGYGFDLPAQNTAGMNLYTRTAENEFGCFDTVKLYLTVRQPSTSTDVVYACPNEVVHYGDSVLTGEGLHQVVFTNQQGCDSVVSVTLIQYELPEIVPEPVLVCSNELPYIHGRYIFNESGNYTIEDTTENGCPYSYILQVTVLPSYEYSLDTVICQSETPFYFGGQTFNTTRTRTFTFNTVHGCDSVIYFSITVNPEPQNTDEVTLCLEEGEAFTYGDSVFTQSGSYAVIFESSTGCDSTILLTLTVNRPVTHSFDATSCSSYSWNEITYQESGSYTQTFTAANNCDSIATLNLTINQPVVHNFEAASCDSYNWNDSLYTESGSYIQEFTAANGCDSTVTLQLTLHHSMETAIAEESCDSYTWNDSTYTNSGVYVQEFQTIHGCDSIVTLTLTLHHSVTSSITDSACDEYSWNDSTYTTSGDYTQTFRNENGCDSTVTLHLTIYNSVTSSFEEHACIIYTWDGRDYTSSGSYTRAYTAANGCDSIVTLNLTIGMPNTYEFTETICQYETYDDNGFDLGIQNTAGTFIHDRTVMNASGCDSLVTLTLIVTPSYSITQSITACESHVWNDSTYTESGSYTQEFITANGCDSIVTLNLTISHPIDVEIHDTICQGESYSYLDFAIPAMNFSGDTTFIHRNLVNGCDSTTTLHLRVNPTYFIRIVDTTGIGETYNENGFLIEDPAAGLKRDTLFLQTAAGCDSTVQLVLFVITGIDEYEDLANINLYPNPANSQVTITSDLLMHSMDIYSSAGKLIQRRENLNEYKTEYNVQQLAPGFYIVKIYTEKGISTRKLIVKP